MDWWFLVISDSIETLSELQSRFSHIPEAKSINLQNESILNALVRLDSLTQVELPRCIMIDIDLGSIPGLAAIKTIRTRVALSNIPIVALLPKSFSKKPKDFAPIIKEVQDDYQCLVLRHPIAQMSLEQVLTKLKNYPYYQ